MTKEEVLQNCTVEGNIVKLPNVQLDRKVYQEVAKALELIGGKWKGGKVAGFVFALDPTDLLDEIANGSSRNLKKEFQFFATPDDLADYLVELANIKPNSTILEPSAGQGAIIAAIQRESNNLVDCYELMELNRIMLAKSGLTYNLIGEDFLTHSTTFYDRIIANPPFSKNQDIEHVYKMYDYLQNNGRLVSVMSNSWFNGTQKKHVQFKEWLDEVDAEVLDVESGTFKASGTMVGAKIVIIDKK